MSMKAVVLREPGGYEKLQYDDAHPIPKLKAGEVLVKNTLAGMNFADVYFRTGQYPSPSGYPLILGLEAIGTIVDICAPNPFGFQKGERVLFSNVPGAYAEYSAVPGERAVRARPDIDDEVAVGGYTIGLTALSLLEHAHSPTEGQTVLVHAAAGGVGLTLCQLLRLRGVTVIGTASDEAKFDVARANGATNMINYKSAAALSWPDQVKRLTDGRGVDAVFDSVGKNTWEGSFEVTKLRGKVVFFGMASGKMPQVDLSVYSRKRNVSVLYSALVNTISTRAELESYSSTVQELLVEGKIKVTAHKTYPLEDVVLAQRELESRKTVGKIYIKI